MGSIVALILILVTVYFVVLVGTVAYQLTGLDWETAQFQALSAFTMSGFTTRISELVVQHPLRRRITMILIVSGYAATATVVATLVSSVANKPALTTVENVVGMAVVVALFVMAVRRSTLRERLVGPIRGFLQTRILPDQVPQEELLEYQQGYGIVRIEVPLNSRLAGRKLRECALKDYRLQVLAIERRGEVIAVPHGDERLDVGDHVVLYGRMKLVDSAFAPEGAASPPMSERG